MARPLMSSLNETTIEQARVLMVKLLPEIDVSIATGQYVICAVMGYIAAQKRNDISLEDVYDFVMRLCGEHRWRVSKWRIGHTLRYRVRKFVAAVSELVKV